MAVLMFRTKSVRNLGFHVDSKEFPLTAKGFPAFPCTSFVQLILVLEYLLYLILSFSIFFTIYSWALFLRLIDSFVESLFRSWCAEPTSFLFFIVLHYVLLVAYAFCVFPPFQITALPSPSPHFTAGSFPVFSEQQLWFLWACLGLCFVHGLHNEHLALFPSGHGCTGISDQNRNRTQCKLRAREGTGVGQPLALGEMEPAWGVWITENLTALQHLGSQGEEKNSLPLRNERWTRSDWVELLFEHSFLACDSNS